MKNKHFLTIALSMFLALFVCCSNEKTEDFVVEVANDVLRSEIITYQDSFMMEKGKWMMSKGDSCYVTVYGKVLNDSMFRYSISYISEFGLLDISPAEFVCNINGHTVFFRMAAGAATYYDDRHFFRIPLNRRRALEERYFPHQLADYLQWQKDSAAGKTRDMLYILHHPTICFLTFLRDSLIDKQYESGREEDWVKVKIGDKEVWM